VVTFILPFIIYFDQLPLLPGISIVRDMHRYSYLAGGAKAPVLWRDFAKSGAHPFAHSLRTPRKRHLNCAEDLP
jgi:hypothetical protein